MAAHLQHVADAAVRQGGSKVPKVFAAFAARMVSLAELRLG